MSDPTVSHQSDQEAAIQPRLTLDTTHTYRGFFDDGAICRLRIFERDGHPPVVVLTELADNTNTSITNLIEHLIPEIVRDYLPHRAHESPTCIPLEHYGEILSSRRRKVGPTVAQVSFPSWRPSIVSLAGVQRLTYGDPSWAHLDETAVAELIGAGVELDGE